MDYLWAAYHEPFGSNLFQRVYDFGGPIPPPVETFDILLESGDRMLTEASDFMILEQSP